MSAPMHLDHDRCTAVVRSKDPRYDGWFVTGVLSTRIYCRPSCPAITPRVHNMRFYPSAAAAQSAGFRACKRCAPDATPGSPQWHVRGDAAARAVRLVGDGVIDREGVGGLASRMGYSVRHLERLLQDELGAGPLALARAQRAQAARVLLESTTLPMAQVAYAAGFSSIRSFNDTIAGVYAATPTQLRSLAARGRGGAPSGGAGAGSGAPVTITVRLPFREPLHVPSLWGHLVATAVPGVEAWAGGALTCAVRLPGGPGVVRLRPPGPGERHVLASVQLTEVADLAAAIGRCRRMLDLDADPEAVDAHLATDPALTSLVRSAPGVRLPGASNGADLALRAVLGQQVSTVRAAGLAAQLVQRLGTPLPPAFAGGSGPGDGADLPVTHLFPEPGAVADAAEDELPGMPRSRRRSLRALAAALEEGRIDLGPGADRQSAHEQLVAVPGVGPWTAQIVLLRALGDPDAFPASDLGLRRSAAAAGLPDQARSLAAHAERWRPWRSYASALLWAGSDHPAARLPSDQHRLPTDQVRPEDGRPRRTAPARAPHTLVPSLQEDR